MRTGVRLARNAALTVLIMLVPASAQTGRVPINDLGTDRFLGQFQGGLYLGGSNTAPGCDGDAASYWCDEDAASCCVGLSHGLTGGGIGTGPIRVRADGGVAAGAAGWRPMLGRPFTVPSALSLLPCAAAGVPWVRG